ncbi:hypothetical protein DXG01_011832 [Tephrocybe rancida]|nr:hypothetical protein DXG01_011832 [Tephrocybe rancida]
MEDLKSSEGSVAPDQVYRPQVDTSSINERRLMRKIDLRVIPWLALLYLFNFMDRGSVGNAKLYNLLPDIHITDPQYLIALTVFFIPYAFFEPVSNVFLRRLRPSVWLSMMIFLWGIVMTLHGIIHNYGGFVTMRVLLGLTEAGMYPGIVYYISSWYKRSEMGTRIAIFFSSATVAGAFSGLLAVAIVKMDGIGNRPGWAWIFIIEGLATIVAALFSYWIIQDFPDTAKFLTEEEHSAGARPRWTGVFVIRRLQADMQFSASGEKFRMSYVYQSLRDWKTWVAMGIYMGFALFGVGLVAYIILTVSTSPALSYFAVYLAVSAIYPIIPNSVAWVASNVEGTYKRSVTLGIAIGFGNLNGAVTVNVYRAAYSPRYRLGHGIVFAYIAIGFICTIIFGTFLQRENARRDRGERDEVIEGIQNKHADPKNGSYESVQAARIDKGDGWSGFRYTI